MFELAQQLIELTGSSSQLQFQPLPQHDPRHRQPDRQGRPGLGHHRAAARWAREDDRLFSRGGGCLLPFERQRLILGVQGPEEYP